MTSRIKPKLLIKTLILLSTGASLVACGGGGGGGGGYTPTAGNSSPIYSPSTGSDYGYGNSSSSSGSSNITVSKPSYIPPAISNSEIEALKAKAAKTAELSNTLKTSYDYGSFYNGDHLKEGVDHLSGRNSFYNERDRVDSRFNVYSSTNSLTSYPSIRNVTNTNATVDSDAFLSNGSADLFDLVTNATGRVAVYDEPMRNVLNYDKSRISQHYYEVDNRNYNSSNIQYTNSYLNLNRNAKPNELSSHGDEVVYTLMANNDGEYNYTRTPGLMKKYGMVRFIAPEQNNWEREGVDSSLFTSSAKKYVVEKAVQDGYKIFNFSWGTPVEETDIAEAYSILYGNYLKNNLPTINYNTVDTRTGWGIFKWFQEQRDIEVPTNQSLENRVAFARLLKQTNFLHDYDQKVKDFRLARGYYSNKSSTVEKLEKINDEKLFKELESFVRKNDVLIVASMGNGYDIDPDTGERISDVKIKLTSLYMYADAETYQGLNKSLVFVTAYDPKRIWTASTCNESRDICLAAPSWVYAEYSPQAKQAYNRYGIAAQDGTIVGTSFAAPYVSSVAALVRSIYPWMSAHNLQQTLLTTAKDIGLTGIDYRYGRGLVQPQVAANGPMSFTRADSTAPIDFVANLDNNPNILPNNKTYYFNNPMSGKVNFTVQGGLTRNLALEFTRNNSFTGNVHVRAGTLKLSGSMPYADVKVTDGGTFQGSGAVNSLTVNNAKVIGSYNLNSAAMYESTNRINRSNVGIYQPVSGYSLKNSLVVRSNLDLQTGATVGVYLGQPLLVAGRTKISDSAKLELLGVTRAVVTPDAYFFGDVLYSGQGFDGYFADVTTKNSLFTITDAEPAVQLVIKNNDGSSDYLSNTDYTSKSLWVKVKYNGYSNALRSLAPSSRSSAELLTLSSGASNLDILTRQVATQQGSNNNAGSNATNFNFSGLTLASNSDTDAMDTLLSRDNQASNLTLATDEAAASNTVNTGTSNSEVTTTSVATPNTAAPSSSEATASVTDATTPNGVTSATNEATGTTSPSAPATTNSNSALANLLINLQNSDNKSLVNSIRAFAGQEFSQVAQQQALEQSKFSLRNLSNLDSLTRQENGDTVLVSGAYEAGSTSHNLPLHLTLVHKESDWLASLGLSATFGKYQVMDATVAQDGTTTNADANTQANSKLYTMQGQLGYQVAQAKDFHGWSAQSWLLANLNLTHQQDDFSRNLTVNNQGYNFNHSQKLTSYQGQLLANVNLNNQDLNLGLLAGITYRGNLGNNQLVEKFTTTAGDSFSHTINPASYQAWGYVAGLNASYNLKDYDLKLYGQLLLTSNPYADSVIKATLADGKVTGNLNYTSAIVTAPTVHLLSKVGVSKEVSGVNLDASLYHLKASKNEFGGQLTVTKKF